MVPRRGVRSAVAVLLAAAVTAACTGSDKGGPAPTTSTTATPGRASPEGWQRSSSPALADGTASATLAAALPPAAGDRWVVAGTTFDEHGVPQATVWRSEDALLWEAQPVGGSHTEAFSATRAGDGALVVVGREGTAGAGRAAAWVERDGRFTAAGGGDALAGAGRVEMDDVVAGPGGLVAVGTRSQAGQEDAVAVWRSSTGQTWERLPAAEAVFAATPGAAVASLVAVPGGVVAVGSVHAGDDADGAAWFSADGASWAAAGRAPDFSGAGPQYLSDAAAVDGGVVAVGAVSEGARAKPAAWRSKDGRSWAPAGGSFELQGTSSDSVGTAVSAVRRAAAGLVAVGGGTAARRMWASTDGVTWSEVPLPELISYGTGFDARLLALDGSDVLVGSSVAGVPRLLLLRDGQWTDVTGQDTGFPSPRPDVCCISLAAAGGRLAAVADVDRAGRALGSGGTEVAVYSSSDGLQWTTADGAPFRDARAGAVGADPAGRLVAVGGLEPPPTAGGQHALATWTEFGRRWRRDRVLALAGDDPQEGGTRRFSATATRDGRMVVAGIAFVGDGAEANVDGVVFAGDGSGELRPVDGVPGMTGAGDQYVEGACAGPAGWVVVGAVQSGSERDAAAWFSTDGTTWSQVQSPSFGGAGAQDMQRCAAAGDGFVAVGSAAAGDSTDAAVWWSPDGRTWERSPAPTLGGDDEQVAADVAGDGAEVVAVGADRSGGDYAVALWHSGDGGRTWDRIDPGAPFGTERFAYADAVVVTGRRVVVAGVADDRVAVWAGPWPLRRGA